MNIQDVRTILHVFERCDEGSDMRLTSKDMAKKATFKGTGNLEAIPNVSHEVALTKKSKSADFLFSCAWTFPSTVLHLISGRLDFKNIKALVADEDGAMVCRNLLTELSISRPLHVETKKLLEANIHRLDETDLNFSNQLPFSMVKLGRLITGCLKRQFKHDKRLGADRPRVDYNHSRTEKGSLPNLSLLDPIDMNQHAHICKADEDIEETAGDNSLADIYKSNVKNVSRDHMEVSYMLISDGTPAKLPQLDIELTPDAKSI